MENKSYEKFLERYDFINPRKPKKVQSLSTKAGLKDFEAFYDIEIKKQFNEPTTRKSRKTPKEANT